jgi:hypothetical protein
LLTPDRTRLALKLHALELQIGNPHGQLLALDLAVQIGQRNLNYRHTRS